MSKPESCQPNAMPTGYVQWHGEAERRYKAGAKQARCLTCKLYRFADEACPLATFLPGREPRPEREGQSFMTLRPGGGPARLLLELWARQALGFRESLTVPSPARRRLQELGYVNHLGGWMCRLTPAGRAAAQTLDAGSR